MRKKTFIFDFDVEKIPLRNTFSDQNSNAPNLY